MSGSSRSSAEGGLLLALESSTPHGSVAIGRKGVVLAERVLPGASRQTAEILPAIDDLLGETGVVPGTIEGILVGSGPGSFTGVRVAGATGKGLAFGWGVPLHPLPSPTGAAASIREEDLRGFPKSEAVAVLFDARGDRVYHALHRLDPQRSLLLPPGPAHLPDLLPRYPAGTIAVGDGALRHREFLEEAGFPVLPAPIGFPSAGGLLLAAGWYDEGMLPLADPSEWEPSYLKEPGMTSLGRVPLKRGE